MSRINKSKSMFGVGFVWSTMLSETRKNLWVCINQGIFCVLLLWNVSLILLQTVSTRCALHSFFVLEFVHLANITGKGRTLKLYWNTFGNNSWHKSGKGLKSHKATALQCIVLVFIFRLLSRRRICASVFLRERDSFRLVQKLWATSHRFKYESDNVQDSKKVHNFFF